ncbi:MAG: LysE family transporter [Hyphomicrobiaceae bacterium]
MEQQAAYLVTAITLALPGPTNTLLALAGTVAGFRRSARLAAAAVLGYGLAVGLLVGVAAPMIAAEPMIGRLLHLAAAAVLAHAAMCLWRSSCRTVAAVSTQAVLWRHVFFTTLFNPKALVLAMLVMSGTARAQTNLTMAVILPFLIAASALLWISIGAAVRAKLPSFANNGWIERGGAIVLLGFAAAVTASAFR